MEKERKSMQPNIGGGTEGSTSVWIELKELDWEPFTSGLPELEFKKGEVIYHQEGRSPYVFFVKSGRVRMDIYSEGGRRRTLFIACAGSIFGELTPIDGEFNICEAIASTNCKLLRMNGETFNDLIKTNSGFAWNVCYTLSQKLRIMSDSIKQLSFDNSKFKVANAMLQLFRRYSCDMPAGKKGLTLRFTHQELADLTGLSRVSVSNILNEFVSLGYLEKQRGYFVAKDIEGLRKQYLSGEKI